MSEEVERAHQEYEAFVADPRHRGFNAEAFWMASRGLLETWLAEEEAKHAGVEVALQGIGSTARISNLG